MRWILLLLPLLLAPVAYAQTESPAFWLEDVAEEEGERLAEDLSVLAEQPVDLNRATADELAQIPGLTAVTAFRIVQERRAHGPFKSVDEVARVPGIEAAAVETMRPFLKIVAPGDGAPTVHPAAARGKRRPQIYLSQAAGRRTSEGAREGPMRVLTRIRARSAGGVSAHLTLEQDPGEPFDWRPGRHRFGYDFVSGSLELPGVGPIERIIVGDYTGAFGYGLGFWQQARYSAGADPVAAPGRRGGGLRPYGGTDENRFLFGAAADLKVSRSATAAVFVSKRRLDAATSCAEDACTARPLATGYHRTEAERTARGALGVKTTGLALRTSAGRLQVGVTAFAARYDLPLDYGTEAYRMFAQAGHTSGALSFDAQWRLPASILFAEVGRSGGKTAALVGVEVVRERVGEVVLAVRRYPAGYANPYAGAFGRGSEGASNESGVYIGASLMPTRFWTLAVSADAYRYPWLRYGVPVPTYGRVVTVRSTYKPRPWVTLYAQGQMQDRRGGAVLVDAANRAVRSVAGEHRATARLHGEYVFSRAVRVRARLEMARWSGEAGNAETGVMLYQEVRLSPWKRLQLDARVALYETDGYQSRVYAFEADPVYSFLAPAYSGSGSRVYVAARLLLGSRVQIEVKGGETRQESDYLRPPAVPVAAGRDFGIRLTMRH